MVAGRVRVQLWRVRQAIGRRVDLGSLLYQQGVFEEYDSFAANDAPILAKNLVYAFPCAKSFLDVGAGTGRYVAELARYDRAATGIERSGIARRIARERHGVVLGGFDLRSRLNPVPVDVAYCFEVAKHIPARFASRLAEFLVSCAPVIVLTAAVPGQGGVGHVNEREPEYWERLFAAAGYQRDDTAEERLFGELPLASLADHWAVTSKFVFVSRPQRPAASGLMG
jgi:SAM-dependent methyltransferase